MVRAGVPGHYVFHWGEEIGGQGSSGLVDEWPTVLDGVRFVIALDRRGTGDVITHQGMRRTASEAFALSLADQLNATGLAYSPSSHGIYTDSYEYADKVPECTNLSVGYAGEHSKNECLDIEHVESLLSALCGLDQSALVEARVPMPETWSGNRSTVVWSYGAVDTCEYCGLSYYACESDALDRESFCCEACETQYLVECRYRDVYLTKEYNDVQAALLPFTRTVQ
jgi:hypothetical protein